MTPKRLEKVHRYFKRYGTMTILLARFLAGLRAATYLLAGTTGMRFKQFFWLDFLAAIVSVPVVTYLGYLFAPQLESLLKLFRRVEGIAVLLVILIGIAI